MKLQDFSSLAEAQAYTETGTKMISPDMMVAFLATFGIFREAEQENTEAAAALRAALQFGSEFNFINNHPASVVPLLETMNCATDAFKTYCINYANPIKQPFKDATQEDFDKAKLEVNPTKVEASYPSADYIINKHREKIIVSVTITDPLPYEDIITFTASSCNTEMVNGVETNNFALDQRPRASISVPAGFTGSLTTEFNYTALLTKVKAFAQSKYQRSFTAKIINAVG